jgi:hypothetical protein
LGGFTLFGMGAGGLSMTTTGFGIGFVTGGAGAGTVEIVVEGVDVVTGLSTFNLILAWSLSDSRFRSSILFQS